MGDAITASARSLTLQAKLPSVADIRLIKNGEVIKTDHSDMLLHVTSEPGIYRVEVYRHYLGKMRGWIFSNPIYIN
jgi:hypothetical protein